MERLRRRSYSWTNHTTPLERKAARVWTAKVKHWNWNTKEEKSQQRWESRWSRARSQAQAQAVPKLRKKKSNGSHFPSTLSSPHTAEPPPPPLPGTSWPGTEPRASTSGTQTNAASTASLSVSATPIPLPFSPLPPLRSFLFSLSLSLSLFIPLSAFRFSFVEMESNANSRWIWNRCCNRTRCSISMSAKSPSTGKEQRYSFSVPRLSLLCTSTDAPLRRTWTWFAGTVPSGTH